jgi:hypothetical protein
MIVGSSLIEIARMRQDPSAAARHPEPESTGSDPDPAADQQPERKCERHDEQRNRETTLGTAPPFPVGNPISHPPTLGTIGSLPTANIIAAQRGRNWTELWLANDKKTLNAPKFLIMRAER